MKHPKLWDGISSVLVLFGLGLYGSSCYYGIWALIYVALGCIVLGVLIAVRTQRCPFCHDVFHRQKDVLPALRQRRARGQKRLTAPSFSAMLDASCMRKRGYHETWPVPDAGHGVQNGE